MQRKVGRKPGNTLPIKVISCYRCGKPTEAKRSDAFCRDCKRESERAKYKRVDLKRTGVCIVCGEKTARAKAGTASGYCALCWAQELSRRNSGASNPMWKGGRHENDGYVHIRIIHDHRGSASYRLEHHLVWEAAYGPVPQGWIIHHLNGVKNDNRLENLLALPRHEHHKHPREALRPYEARIRDLEAEVERLRK